MVRTMGARRFVRAMGGERTRRTYGSHFVFEEEEVPGAHRQWVRRCGFYDDLAHHGVPELTTVLCAWDCCGPTRPTGRIGVSGSSVR